MNQHPLVDEIVAARKARGWTQAELAHATRRSVSSINHFENDPGGRNITVIEEIAEEFGLRLALVPIEQSADEGERMFHAVLHRFTDPAGRSSDSCTDERVPAQMVREAS